MNVKKTYASRKLAQNKGELHWNTNASNLFIMIHNVIEEAKYLYFSEGFDSYDDCIKESKIVHSFFLLRLLTKVIYFKFLMKLKIG